MIHRVLLSIITSFAVFAAWGADNKPEITFANTSYDLGTIHASGGTVSATYTFTNTGTAPLMIISVSNGGCGCTKPSFTKEPIAPGKTGKITIHFDPSGRRGELNRKVKVTTNAPGKRKTLTFTGSIIP